MRWERRDRGPHGNKREDAQGAWLQKECTTGALFLLILKNRLIRDLMIKVLRHERQGGAFEGTTGTALGTSKD
jgi:hypothetical protein